MLAALRALPRRQREVIALRVFLDLDIATTAGLLGIAPGTVGAHLSRAVTTLRAALPLDAWALGPDGPGRGRRPSGLGRRSAHYRPGGHPMNTDSTTTAVLTAVRRAVDEATPAGGADAGLPQVLTAARARRRRRRVTAGGGAAGAGLAVGAALTLALGAPGTGPG